jgi:hypothetical protein
MRNQGAEGQQMLFEGVTADGTMLSDMEQCRDAEFSKESRELEKVAGIPEASMASVCSSPRLARSEDVHILAKAGTAARRNLELDGGMPNSDSFSHEQCSVVVNGFQQLGIILGSCEEERSFILDNLCSV